MPKVDMPTAGVGTVWRVHAVEAPSILLADDDPSHRALMRRRLEQARPELVITEIGSGSGFVDALRAGHFDCAVLDYNMSDAQADGLLQRLGMDVNRCPIIVISASTDQQTAIECFRNGAVDFVGKVNALAGAPLLERIEHAIDQYKRMVQTYRRMERRQNRLAHLAETDALTGLHNRRCLVRLLKHRSENPDHADRRRSMACVMVDIDHFKQINDTFGHAMGDQVLQQVAQLSRQISSAGDLAVRWGGEEMLFVLDSADLYRAWNWAETLRQTIQQQSFGRGREEFAVTISCGVVSFPSAQMGQRMIELADQAMYLAKRTGRNRVCTWQMAVVDDAIDRLRGHDNLTPAGRRQELLASCGAILGRTQREHVGPHCDAVADLAGRLAQAMGLEPAQQSQARLAALMHDIGKCLLPETLLARRGPLTDQQRKLIARHSQYGAQIARALGAPWDIAAAIEHHHHPYRLSDAAPSAPAVARIISVADAVVAMLTDRPYRPAMTVEQALAELRRGSGTQFDPAAVVSAHQLDYLLTPPAQAA